MIANNSTKLERIIFICYIARNKIKTITMCINNQVGSRKRYGGAGVELAIHVTPAIILFNMKQRATIEFFFSEVCSEVDCYFHLLNIEWYRRLAQVLPNTIVIAIKL
jgi:hypothetical protein